MREFFLSPMKLYPNAAAAANAPMTKTKAVTLTVLDFDLTFEMGIEYWTINGLIIALSRG